MHRFSATTESSALVAAGRAQIWAVLVDPAMLVKLTPLLRRIDVDGDLWRWHLVKIGALGVSAQPVFTELMRFEQERRIRYSHQPSPGVTERQGADGYYELTDEPGGTRLTIGLTLQIELPVSSLAGPAVTRVIETTIRRTGQRFATNLARELEV